MEKKCVSEFLVFLRCGNLVQLFLRKIFVKLIDLVLWFTRRIIFTKYFSFEFPSHTVEITEIYSNPTEKIFRQITHFVISFVKLLLSRNFGRNFHIKFWPKFPHCASSPGSLRIFREIDFIFAYLSLYLGMNYGRISASRQITFFSSLLFSFKS